MQVTSSSLQPTASLSDPAAERLSTCGAKEVVVTNTLPIGRVEEVSRR